MAKISRGSPFITFFSFEESNLTMKYPWSTSLKSNPCWSFYNDFNFESLVGYPIFLRRSLMKGFHLQTPFWESWEQRDPFFLLESKEWLCFERTPEFSRGIVNCRRSYSMSMGRTCRDNSKAAHLFTLLKCISTELAFVFKPQ